MRKLAHRSSQSSERHFDELRFVQDIAEEENFWAFDFPLWKRLPTYCDSSAPSHPLRFNGTALFGGHIVFSLQLAPTLDSRLVASQAPLVVTLAAADGSLPEIYATIPKCATGA